MRKCLLIILLLYFLLGLVGCDQSNAASQPTASTPPQQHVTDPTTVPPTDPTTVPTTSVFDPALLLAQISEETLESMRGDFFVQFALTSSQINPLDLNFRVYGLWDHACALFVTIPQSGSADTLTYDTVNGLTFVYPNANVMRVYVEHHYYTLTEAFQAGYLSPAELETLYQNYYSAHPHLQSYA